MESFFFKFVANEEVEEIELLVLLGSEEVIDPSTICDPTFSELTQFGSMIPNAAKTDFYRLLLQGSLRTKIPPLPYWNRTHQMILFRNDAMHRDRYESSVWENQSVSLDLDLYGVYHCYPDTDATNAYAAIVFSDKSPQNGPKHAAMDLTPTRKDLAPAEERTKRTIDDLPMCSSTPLDNPFGLLEYLTTYPMPEIVNIPVVDPKPIDWDLKSNVDSSTPDASAKGALSTNEFKNHSPTGTLYLAVRLAKQELHPPLKPVPCVGMCADPIAEYLAGLFVKQKAIIHKLLNLHILDCWIELDTSSVIILDIPFIKLTLI